MFLYVKALHIIFIVTWFSGMFYIVRLFVYNREANDKPEVEKQTLQSQYKLMIKRLWLGITWPSAILTLIFGLWLLHLYGSIPQWLWIKLGFVLGLYIYHFYLQRIYKQQQQGIFKHSSQQLRLINEIPTVFLVAIVMLVVVKNAMSLPWALGGLVVFVLLLMLAIRIYKRLRKG